MAIDARHQRWRWGQRPNVQARTYWSTLSNSNNSSGGGGSGGDDGDGNDNDDGSGGGNVKKSEIVGDGDSDGSGFLAPWSTKPPCTPEMRRISVLHKVA